MRVSIPLLALSAAAPALSAPLLGLNLPSSQPNYLQSSLNTILSQATILPNNLVTTLQSTLTPMLITPNTPVGVQLLVNTLNLGVKSIVATTTGNSQAAVVGIVDCLSEIASRQKGLQEGEQCLIGQGGTAASLRTALNAAIEQGAGVMPPNIVRGLQQTITPLITTILPSSDTLVNNINSAMLSVASSASGETVSAFENAQPCLDKIILGGGIQEGYQCFVATPLVNLENIFNGALQQFVGILPPNIVQDLNAQIGPLIPKTNTPFDIVQPAVSNALLSTTSATPAVVTSLQALEHCINYSLASNGKLPAECLATNGPVVSPLRAAVNGVIDQAFSVLGPNVFVALSDTVSSLLDSSPSSSLLDSINSAIKNYFIITSQSIPPAVTNLESCILDVVLNHNGTLPTDYVCSFA